MNVTLNLKSFSFYIFTVGF